MNEYLNTPPAMDGIRPRKTLPPNNKPPKNHRFLRRLGRLLLKLPIIFIAPLKPVRSLIMRRPVYGIPAALLIAVGLMFLGLYWGEVTPQLTNQEFVSATIITDATPLAVEMSFKLEIVIMGQKQAIPHSYGHVAEGRLVLNTITDSGIIRVQSPEDRIFYLADFFTIWESPFNSQCIFTHCESSSRKLTFLVNGQPNDQFEKYQLQDGDEIKITMESVTLPPKGEEQLLPRPVSNY